ncbi:MAG: efflux RND transporter permease subunit [Myxococcales bacterium]|nr:efflux RND transporter permease subunit [Myxococcales bacterium]
MRWLLETVLRLRVIVVAAAVIFMVAGVYSASTTPVDVFPEFAPPRVEIQTEAPGLSSTEVEALVSVPIENAFVGITGLKTLRSKSVLGLSSVLLIFNEGTDLLMARTLVQERLARAASQLPAASRPPVILAPLSSLSRVLKIGVWSDTQSQMELTDLVRWVVRPRLMAVPGVANVAIWGQRDRQLQVRVDPDRLRAHGVRLDDVTRATRDAVVPAAGGFVDTPNQRLAVTQVATVNTAAELAEVPVVARGVTPLRLGDVADIVEDHPPPIGDAIINDRPGLLLIVEKQPDANSLAVTRGVEAALGALAPTLRGAHFDPTIFRPASFVERAIGNLRRALILGCALVVLILAVFLYDLRTALISVLAIPLSLLAAAMILRARGGTLDTMALAGLAIALGEVVDDAIIDVENIVRRLRLNRERPHPQSAFAVVLGASLEVRSAVVYATLIVVMVLLPVYFLGGLAGSFFRPLAVSYGLGVVASMAVALTVTPALALILLPRGVETHRESPIAPPLRRLYARLLPLIVDRAKPAAALVFVSFVVAGVAFTRLGEGFLPEFQETDFLMHWVGKPGTSLEAMRRTTARASRELRAIAGVRNFGSHIGRAEVADEVVGPNFTELWISLDPDADYAPAVARIRETVDGYPGLYRDVQTYLQERVKEVLTGTSGAVVVRIFGPDLATLRATAAEVGRALGSVAGVVDLKVEPQVLVPQIEVRLRPAAARRFGLTPGEVRRAAATLLQGTRVGEVYRSPQVVDVVVWGTPNLRTDLAALRRLPIETAAGARVSLGDVADLEIAPSPNVIQREGASRRIDVTCNVRGRDLGAGVRDIRARLAQVPMPPGHHAEVLGEFEARAQAQSRLVALGALSLLGILAVLYADFRSARLTLLAFATLPFALVGAVAAASLGEGVLSLGSLVGFVTVLGIAARNGIMLVSHYRHLELEEGVPFGRALVLRGAVERLAPILMTALATALALVPLAVAGNRPGHEIEHPMARVILGGLVTSTLLNLFVMPALYLWLGGSARDAETEA